MKFEQNYTLNETIEFENTSERLSGVRELTDEDLEQVVGGWGGHGHHRCWRCHRRCWDCHHRCWDCDDYDD